MLALFLLNLTIDDSAMLTALCKVLGYTLYFGWFLLLGNSLFPSLPPDTGYNLTWFLLDTFLLIVCLTAIAVLTENGSYHAQGLAALPGFYMFFAAVHAPWFLAAAIVAIEKQRKPEFGFYFGTLLGLLGWPIGVWFIQPRINKIAKNAQVNA